MQAEREGRTTDGDLIRSFDEAQEFNQQKMEELLEQRDVKEVHVFKATPQNLKFAALRKQYPNASRKRIRAYMKRKKKEQNGTKS